MLTFLKSKKFYLLALLIVVVIGGYYLLKDDEGIQFETEKIEITDIKQIVDVNGTVESNAIINLRFQRTGKLEDIFSEVGSQVTEGQQLAKIEDRDAQIEVDRTYAGVKLAKAELNLKYAGPSYEEIVVSETKIKEAQVNLVNSKKRLNDVYLTSQENEKNAELQVEKAKIALDNAEKALGNLEESSETTQDIAELDLTSTYEDSKTEIINAIDELFSSLDQVDSVLGVDDKSINDDFENKLGAKNQTTLIGSEGAYKSTKNKIITLNDNYKNVSTTWEEEQVEDLLDESSIVLYEMKQLLDQTYQILENTKTDNADWNISNPFTDTDLSALKTAINAKQQLISSRLTHIQNLIQTIENAKLGISSTELSTTSALDDAEAALAQAEKDLEIAENNLDSVLIDNKIAEHNAQMEIDINDVRLQQAQANHNKLIASPRWVDVASLEARIEQAEASYNQALKDLEDTILTSPTDGVITEINVDTGENIALADDAFVLITDDLKITANISETDITKVKVGDEVDITLDAFPSDTIFYGKVVSIDPAETVIQGVIYYEATITFDPEKSQVDQSEIKSGMTADLEILSAEKEQVPTLSLQSIHYDNGDIFVYILENGQKVQQNIKTGLEGEDRIEILSGLEQDQTVILYEK